MKFIETKISLSLVLFLLLLGCKPGPSADGIRAQEYQKQLDQCRTELAKNPLIPIIGGGYLDTKYFAFNVPAVRFEEGQCGTDGFTSDFYWTGEKIVPAAPKFTGIPPGQPIPKEWLFFQVGAKFGNLKMARHCKDKRGVVPECPEYDVPRPLKNLLAEKKVVPKNYPELEIVLSNWSMEDMYNTSFRMREWPRDDGYPRTISCFAITGAGFDKKPMTREDYENIDFGSHKFPCQLEYGDFSIKGGAARVHTGTEALRKITPGLKALNAYINQAIIQEE
jgi:hypothetical protein